MRAVWFVIAIVSAACRGDHGVSGTMRVSWHIVDSSWVTPWDEMTDSVAVYRIAVAGPGHTDTLADILPPWPVIVGDSVVYGVRKVNGESDRDVFRWSIAAKRMLLQALPNDVLSGYNDVMISPRAQFVAYVAKADTGGPYGVVRDLASEQLVWHGPTVGGCDCDVDLSHARWVTADSFEIAVVSTANNQGWAIFSGSAASRRAHLTYVRTEPAWHLGARQ